MLQRQDLILLLSELESAGMDVSQQLNKVVRSQSIPLDVLKFINDSRQLDVTAFYKHIRKTYNEKKSKLYKNIVSEVKDPQEVTTTLASFALQTLLFSKNADDPDMFLKHARFKEVEECLLDYAESYDLTGCMKLLRVLKADCKALESVYR